MTEKLSEERMARCRAVEENLADIRVRIARAAYLCYNKRAE